MVFFWIYRIYLFSVKRSELWWNLFKLNINQAKIGSSAYFKTGGNIHDGLDTELGIGKNPHERTL